MNSPESPQSNREVPTASIERVTPSEVRAWVNELKTTRPKKDWAHLVGIIDEHAPHGEEADAALALRHKQEMIGATLMRTQPPCVVGAFVLPQYQRRGYGQQLIERAVRALAEHTTEKILLEVCDTRALEIAESLPPDLRSKIQIEDVRQDV